jgi:signal transduction histidine kinase
LVNAAKYSPKGSMIELGVVNVGDRVQLSVVDEGEGVPERERAAIFEEFYRSPGAAADGIGLGLPLVKRIARAQGGRVWAEANSPRGARFVMELPAAEEEGN